MAMRIIGGGSGWLYLFLFLLLLTRPALKFFLIYGVAYLFSVLLIYLLSYFHRYIFLFFSIFKYECSKDKKKKQQCTAAFVSRRGFRED